MRENETISVNPKSDSYFIVTVDDYGEMWYRTGAHRWDKDRKWAHVYTIKQAEYTTQYPFRHKVEIRHVDECGGIVERTSEEDRNHRLIPRPYGAVSYRTLKML